MLPQLQLVELQKEMIPLYVLEKKKGIEVSQLSQIC